VSSTIKVPPIPISKKYDREIAFEIENDLGFHHIVSKILSSRGFKSDEKLKEFLNPKLSAIPKPDTLADFEKSITRIVKAISHKEKIGIFGDYDMDGIGSASIISLFFTAINVSHHTVIAQRQSGYGLTPTEIENFESKGVSLIIACDVGSTDYDAANLALAHGIDLIIIDHHHIEKPFPPAFSIVNPHRSDSNFEYKDMATVGLIFYTVAFLKTRLLNDGYFSKDELPDVRDYLDICALGTLADISPLTGINRILVSYGISLLKKRERISLKPLFELSNMRSPGTITEKSIVFKLVPKFNAPGRMGNSYLSFEQLTSKDIETAHNLALQLIEINNKRRELQEKFYIEAMDQALTSLDFRWVVVVSNTEWHAGIVGIVAAKLAEHFQRPSVVISINGDKGRGSVRSWGNINIYEALELSKKHLISFGGHKGAAGLELQVCNIGSFAEDFDKALILNKKEEDNSFDVDVEISFSDLTPKFLLDLNLLSPFGNGNPEPVFYTKDIEVKSAKYPKGVHLSLILKDPITGISQRAIGFNMAKEKASLKQSVNLIYVVEKDLYRGGNNIQLRLLKIWS
jgi:single-stranded-DNA-specific exonuclease